MKVREEAFNYIGRNLINKFRVPWKLHFLLAQKISSLGISNVFKENFDIKAKLSRANS